MAEFNHNEPSDASLKVFSSAFAKTGGNFCLKAAKHDTKPAHSLCRISLAAKSTCSVASTNAST